MIRRIVTDRGDRGQRLDLVFRRHLADLRGATRTQVQAWILDGAVTVNGRAVRRTAARVAAGDVLTVDLPAGVVAARTAMPAQELALETLYEDEHLIEIGRAHV